MDAETRATIQALRQMGNTLGAKSMIAMMHSRALKSSVNKGRPAKKS